MNNETFQLFVYGSLRSGFHNPVYNYLTQYFTLMGEAVVKGQFFDTGQYPVAMPTTEDHFLTGELYVINNPEEFAWAIGQLDDYEGMNGEADEPILYRRELADVFQNGQPGKAWIYWYNGSVDNMRRIETGDVLKYLQDKNKP